MGIVFYCRSCGARFNANPASAGKRGRCRVCGHETKIPEPAELASKAAMPVGHRPAALPTEVSPPALAARKTPADELTDPPSIIDWLKAGISQVGLAPLSAERIKPVSFLPPALDDNEDSTPYRMAGPGPIPTRGHPSPHFPGPVHRLWIHGLSVVQGLFRWLNESAYLVSIPFVMILLFGAAVKARPMALFGATFVVLLNLGRLAAGGAALVIAPLRTGLDLGHLRKPVRRVLDPAATIAIVILAFTFVPWLSSDRGDRANLANRIEGGAASLKRDMRREVGTVLDKARDLESSIRGERPRIEGEGTGPRLASPRSGDRRVSGDTP